MMSTLFGTDGIRGLANQYPMTAEVAFNLARSVGYYFQDKKAKNVLIGRDTRLSGDMLEAALIAGFCATGMNVLKAGIITTPALAYLTKYFHTTIGIVISASHNHYRDNGIKFFQENGMKFDNAQENEIERILIQEEYRKLSIPGEMIGRVTSLDESGHIYLQHILDFIPKGFTKPEFKMIIDCANGASSFIVKELFDHLKMNYQVIYNTPNGININQNCGSTSIAALQTKVIESRADLGFAYDGDADRVLAV
ncbi:MAG: phosphoglucosamine mutase, partial [Candidatus Atribacteria bacterium]|nr:phosphoglucosamine mutase [Candidatus Atribacteria bacterium]